MEKNCTLFIKRLNMKKINIIEEFSLWNVVPDSAFTVLEPLCKCTPDTYSKTHMAQ